MKSVPYPEVETLEESMLFGLKGMPELRVLRAHLEREGRLSRPALLRLLVASREVLRREPNVLRLEAPVVVFGDFHGQYYDMLAMLDRAGPPEGHVFLFLGDYVDRGDFGCEVALHLLALKLALPDRVFLLRGNHETRTISTSMTFEKECVKKYDAEVFETFMETFDALPIAAVIKREAGDVFCVHAGIGPTTVTLAELDAEPRFRELELGGPFWDLLWSDPWDADGSTNAAVRWRTFAPNDYRRTSVKYGQRAVEKFLSLNRLSCIIRAHEVKIDGYCAHFVDGDKASLKDAKAITVFSAPHYSEFGNIGAFLKVNGSAIEVVQFQDTVPHPFNLPDFQDAISFSLPYLTNSVVNILVKLISLIQTVPDENELKADEELDAKVRILMERSAKIRKQQDEYRRVLSPDYHRNMRAFQDLITRDRDHEALPTDKGGNALPGPNAVEKLTSAYLQHRAILGQSL